MEGGGISAYSRAFRDLRDLLNRHVKLKGLFLWREASTTIFYVKQRLCVCVSLCDVLFSGSLTREQRFLSSPLSLSLSLSLSLRSYSQGPLPFKRAVISLPLSLSPSDLILKVP